MAKSKNKWRNQQGNLCFREDYKPSDAFKVLIISLIILVLCSLAEYFIWGSYYALYGILPILAITCFIVIREDRENDRRLLKIVNKQVDYLVKKECKNLGRIHEVKRKVYTKTKGTYGIVDSRFVLVLLSDNSVLEYKIVFHSDAEQQYSELLNEASICSDSERIAYMSPKEKRKIAPRIHITDGTKLILILFGSLGSGAILILLAVKFKLAFFLGVSGYLLFYVLAECVCDKINTKWASVLNTIISVPVLVLGVIIKMAQPIAVFLFSVVFVPAVIALSVFSICSLLSLAGLPLEYSTRLFLSLTISAFILVYCRKATKWVILHSPMKNWGNHGYEAFSEDLALYVTEPRKFKFYISILYLVFLLWSTIYKLEFGNDFLGEDIYLAVLQSFLVFLAFGSMLNESKEAGLSEKDIIDKIRGLLE